VKPISDMECNACGDTGKIIEPAHWPQGLSLQTHTWDQLRAMAIPGREFSCPKCWRGQMVRLEEGLEPYST
jgi:hypothetical protein